MRFAFAIYRPLPQIGLGNRFFSGLLAFWVGMIGITPSPDPETGTDESPPVQSVTTTEASEEQGLQTTQAVGGPDPAPLANEDRIFGGPVTERVSIPHGDWETVCELDCRTYTVVSYKTYDTAPPSLVVLEIDGSGRLLISGLDTEAQHRKFYTNRAEVELEHLGTRYVAAREFFARPREGRTLSGGQVGPRPNCLKVDGALTLILDYLDESHLGHKLTSEVLEAMRDGTVATLEFNSVSFSGFGPVRFSLIGFTSAVEARTDRVSPSAEPEPESTYDPVLGVGSMISENKFGLERSWLKVRDNPRGEGSFVYIPEMTIAGHKRWFIWFVHVRDAIALNGPSMTASPQLSAPLDVGYKFYDGTGLDAQSVTQFGLDLVFE